MLTLIIVIVVLLALGYGGNSYYTSRSALGTGSGFPGGSNFIWVIVAILILLAVVGHLGGRF